MVGWRGRVLASAFASFGAFAQPSLPKYDEVYLEVLGPDGRILGDDLTAFDREGVLYYPLQPLVGALEFSLTRERVGRFYAGEAGDPSRSFELDLSECRGRGPFRELPLGKQAEGLCRSVWLVDHLVYLPEAELEVLLGVDLSLERRSSRLLVTAGFELPYEGRRRREERSLIESALADRAGAVDLSIPVLVSKSSDWSYPALDENVGVLSTKASRPQFHASGQLRGGLGPFDSTWVHELRPEASAHRLSLRRFDPNARALGVEGLRNVELIDTRRDSLGLVSAVSALRGLRLEGGRDSDVTSADTMDFTGDLPKGWDVELYEDDFRIGTRSSSEKLSYRFDRVSLRRGINRFRLVFLGPAGARREETRNIVQGDWSGGLGLRQWSAAAGQDPASRDLIYGGTLGLVAVPNLFSSFALQGGQSEAVSLATTQRTSLGRSEFQWEGVYQPQIGAHAMRGVWDLSLIEDSSFRLEPSLFRGIQTRDLEYFALTSHLRAQLRGRSDRWLPFDWMFGQDWAWFGETLERRPRGSASISYRGMGLTTRGEGRLRLNSKSWTNEFEAFFSNARTDLRGTLVYVDGNFASWGVKVGSTLDERSALGASFTVFRQGHWNVGADYLARFRPFGVLVGLNCDRAGDWGVGLGINTSFAWSPSAKSLRARESSQVYASSAVFMAYEDTNENGRRDENEPEVPEARFRVGFGRLIAPHELVEDLPSEGWVLVEVDESALPIEAGLAPVASRYRYWARGAREESFEIPFVPSFSFEGEIVRVEGAAKPRPLASVPLILSDRRGNVRRLRSDSLGLVKIDSLKPGDWTLKVDPDFAESLGVTVEPAERNIQVREGRGTVDPGELNFTLRSRAKADLQR